MPRHSKRTTSPGTINVPSDPLHGAAAYFVHRTAEGPLVRLAEAVGRRKAGELVQLSVGQWTPPTIPPDKPVPPEPPQSFGGPTMYQRGERR